MKEYVVMMENTVKTNEYDPKSSLPFGFCMTIGTILAVVALMQIVSYGTSGVSTLLEGALIIVSAIVFRSFHEKQFLLETAVATETDKLLTLQRRSTEMRANMKNNMHDQRQDPGKDSENQTGTQNASDGTENQ